MRTTQEPCALLLELANQTQPEDKPHAALTPLHRLHMKITACLARFREPIAEIQRQLDELKSLLDG